MQRRLQLVLAFFALLAAPAYAQDQFSLLGVDNVPAVVSGSSYTGPGDVFSGATVWLGLRPYNTTWADGTHKPIKIVRSSDSQSCDVFVTTAGVLGNVTGCSGLGSGAVAAFCASDTCKIDKFYDQSGNGWDYVAADATHRATLVFNCIGTLPCADFAGTSWYENFSITSISQGFTTSLVAVRTGAFAAQNDLFDVGAGSFYGPSANQVGGFWGATGVATASDSGWHAIQIVTNSASSTSTVAVDATQTTGLSMGSVAQPAGSFLGTQNTGGTNPFTGKLTEIGIWPVAFTSTQQTNICHNQFTYWGTPTSC